MKLHIMNYKTTIGILIVAGVLVGVNFGGNHLVHLADRSEARASAVWEGECTPHELVNEGDVVALSATCGEKEIKTKSIAAILFYDENRSGTIHCVIFEAGNNKCSPSE